LPLRFYGLRHKTARILAFNSFFGRKNGHYGPNREPCTAAALHVRPPRCCKTGWQGDGHVL
jgi:hypothetical protein